MTPVAQAVIVLCIVVLTAVLISTLLALRKTAIRAESLLHAVERDILPMAIRVEVLTSDLRTLSQHADEELERLGVVVRRVEQVSGKVAQLVVALSGFTRVGQVVGVATGVKKGVDVFLRRLRDRR
jgi:uncharacterized protein YoxC